MCFEIAEMLWRIGLVIILISSLSSAHRDDEEDELQTLMDLGIVPEPVEGSQWWYAPSGKAHKHGHRDPSSIGSSASGGSGIVKTSQGKDWRLPGDLVPVDYKIRLLPFLEVDNFTTDGYVEIIFNCLKDTTNITLNSADLTFDCNSISV